MEKQDPSYNIDGNVKWYSLLGKQFASYVLKMLNINLP